MGSVGFQNGSADLPSQDSPDLHLVVATQEEWLAQQHVNSTEWKGALDLEAYLRREDYLFNQELTKDGGITPWSLVYEPEGSSKRLALCGCESQNKKALVGRQGKVEKVIAHAVASVFCPSQNRGKGYAGRMMSELGKRLSKWQAKDGNQVLFSVLYSDIGKKFYAARGWQAFPSAHVSLPGKPSSADDLPKVQMLKSEDLPELCDIDERLLRSRLAKSSSSGGPAVALLPDSRTLWWHHAREEFVAKELFDRDPAIKGATTGEVGSRVWCYWTRVWTNPQEEEPNTLHILRLVFEDDSFSDFAPASVEGAEKSKQSRSAKSVAALCAAAQAEASQWDMKEVQIWNPTSTTLAAAQLLDTKASIEHREAESIASLQWYGDGSWQSIDWVCNEKYGWC